MNINGTKNGTAYNHLNGKPKTTYRTAMLIDDSEIDNLINRKMLEGSEFAEKILIHTSSRSALEYLWNLDPKDPESVPEWIFLDINMPLMDGFQFMEEFNKLPEDVRELTSVVMLTSSVNPADVDKASKYGDVVKYVNKPLSTAQIGSLK
jgi:CheY-like chemotaxis protein